MLEIKVKKTETKSCPKELKFVIRIEELKVKFYNVSIHRYFHQNRLIKRIQNLAIIQKVRSPIVFKMLKNLRS